MHKIARKLYRKLFPKALDNSNLIREQPLGTVQLFRDVPVVPYEYLGDRPWGFSAHQGGPIWPEWSSQMEARHCRKNVPIDDLPSYSGQSRHQIKSAAWGGAIINHFGHQIADFSTRILHTRVAYPDIKLLFSGKVTDGYVSLNDTPNFFREILDWYDLEPNKVEIISQPTLVNELLVMPQAEQLKGYAPSSAYLDMLDEHVEKKLQRQPKHPITFVSRAGVKARFAGEGYLEFLMKEAGIRVMRPETLSLQEQLAEYEASEQLIFSEGSAVHGLQLLGRCIGQIHVLNRRPGSRMAQNMLSVRSKSLDYIEASRGLVCGLWPNGKLGQATGISILQEKSVVNYLGSVSSALGDSWNHASYLEARDRDVRQWLQAIAEAETAKMALTRKTVIDRLNAVGLSHLVSYAQTVLPASSLSDTRSST